MRTQNRLQQTFAGKLEAGTAVWEWTYETDPDDAEWPPLFRASVSIPVLDKTFVVGGKRKTTTPIPTPRSLNEFKMAPLDPLGLAWV